MQISNLELEEMMARQADRVSMESDQRLDKRLAHWSKVSDKKMDERFERWSQESDERMQRYVGALKEDFNNKLQTVLEYVKDVPEIKRVLDLTFEEVGRLRVDMESVKFAINDLQQRVTVLEGSKEAA